MLFQSIFIMRSNWQYYLAFILILLGAYAFDEIDGKSTSGGATFFLWAMLAQFVHMAVLFNGKFGELNFRDRKFGTYFLAFGLKVLALVILSIVIASPVLFMTMRKSAESSTGPILLFFLLSSFVYVLVLSLLGTWLPAAIYGTGKSILNAAKRGLPAFFPTFGRLFFGILVLQIASLAVATAGSIVLSSASVIVNGMPNIPLMLVVAFSLSIQAFSVTYAAVVLSNLYMVSEGLAPIASSAANA